jgi:hypothetical protein
VERAGTRPDVEAERAELFDWARSVGLELEDVAEGSTMYVTSPFEANALRAAGIKNVPWRWRRGSLARFRRTHCRTLAARPPAPDDREWREIAVGPVRWRIRAAQPVMAPEASPELLGMIVEGDVLPSVSRRHPARQHADVWTSGNRIYRCHHPHMLRMLLEALQYSVHAQVKPAELVRHAFAANLGHEEACAAARAADTIIRVTQVEKHEYGGV